MSAINLSYESFRKLVLEEGRTIIVDFWAPWCSYCRRIGPAYDRVAAERSGLIVAKVNIDDYPQLASGYEIESIPTMILFEGGKELASIVAPESKSQIDEFIDENIGG